VSCARLSGHPFLWRYGKSRRLRGWCNGWKPLPGFVVGEDADMKCAGFQLGGDYRIDGTVFIDRVAGDLFAVDLTVEFRDAASVRRCREPREAR